MEALDVQAACFEISGKSEVRKVSETLRHPFGHLQDSIDRLDRCIREARFEVCKDSVEMVFDGPGQLSEGFQTRARSPTGPPHQGLKITSGEHVLQCLAQTHRSAQLWIGFAELLPQHLLLVIARPNVATQRP